MKIAEILTLSHTQCSVEASSKKRVLEYLSQLIADSVCDINPDELYQKFIARERLGSTGIGEGVAIPHCRVSGCSVITGALIKLSSPIDFESLDSEPVDLIFALVVPEEENEEHLKTLASVAELLQQEARREKLRHASSDEALFKEATMSQAA